MMKMERENGNASGKLVRVLSCDPHKNFPDLVRAFVVDRRAREKNPRSRRPSLALPWMLVVKWVGVP